ncbi:MAG: hypothetical protein V2J55_16650 [Candidatus Competibacteraceae bacterium]|jgi:hypothetical protein|nr:hypothetical protein [Candidatus Competibacteraceae bacterium]
MQRSKLIIYFGAAAAVVAGSWFILSITTKPVITDRTSALQGDGSGPLDGMTFTGMLGPEGKPKDIEDSFVFENGTFVSKECELRCQYPPAPYKVHRANGQTVFVSETRCPYKDAKIVWRGTLDGNTISGVSTWTVKRWYWTVEKNFEFVGTLSIPVASTQ